MRASKLVSKSNEGLTYNDVQIVPQYSEVGSRKDISTKTRLAGDVYIGHPLIPANMDSISCLNMVRESAKHNSVCFFHRFYPNVNTLAEKVWNYLSSPEIMLYKYATIGVSLGVKESDLYVAKHIMDRVNTYSFSSVKLKVVFLIDVAHGDHKLVYEQIERLKATFDAPVIAGNIATPAAAVRMVAAGVDGIKVGVGPGSLCSTRIQTGAGVPQFTAVARVAEIVRTWNDQYGKNVTIIADGGIKYPGDIVKAIGAGANSVMSGYLFAGTDKTPGGVVQKGTFPQEISYKVYRGSASRESKIDRGERDNVEGVAIEVPFRGETSRIFTETLDGIRSGLSYSGFDNLEGAIGNLDFVRNSQSSIVEASPNGMIHGRG